MERKNFVGQALLLIVAMIFGLAWPTITDAGEKLYNGINLPSDWPPEIRHFSREPMPVPYLLSLPAVVPIDVGRQLFVDDFLIEDTTLKRTFHKAKLHPANPVLKPDKPWESKKVRDTDPPHAMPFSDGVWYDPKDKMFKMWYMAGYGKSTCYATSNDGIHWQKPSLDVEPGTNIVQQGTRDSATVWLDLEEKDPQRRYKMMRRDNQNGLHEIHFSADGIHWSDPIGHTGSAQDRSTFFYNPFRKVWVYSIRGGCYFADTESASREIEIRQVYKDKHKDLLWLPRLRRYWEVEDFLAIAKGWPHPDIKPWWKESAGWRASCTPTIWVGSDRLDPARPDVNTDPELYNLDAVAYESLMLGLFSIWRGRAPEYPGRCKINEVCVGFSRDGFHWHRPFREPIVGVSENPEDFNYSNVQSAGGCCIVIRDKLYFYVSGRMVRDTSVRKGYCGTGLATMRRDGFASMDAGQTEGVLTTRPIRFNGKHLFVNTDNPTGELRIEILNKHNKVIKPFTRANCIPVHTDSTIAAVGWKNAEDLSELAGKAVRFRFYLRDGKLYSFWVSPDKSGASFGYVAAGGPGFTESRDTVGSQAYK